MSGRDGNMEEKFARALRLLAPGTPLREGLENILRAKTGALIVIGDSPEIMELAEGGFALNCDFTSANIYELAKMDGAIILSHDARKILYANTQLVPDPAIPSVETGIRHRTAERVARQTGEMVISISQRRGIISLYQGGIKYILQDIATLLTKANQGLHTLEKYKAVIDKTMTNLTALEFEDLVTIFEVVKLLQRIHVFLGMAKEMENFICELGSEGRLVKMQLEELVLNVEDQAMHLIRDYRVPAEGTTAESHWEEIRQVGEEGTDLVDICRILGYGTPLNLLDLPISPRGYRVLDKVPRLPEAVIDNLVKTFGGLQRILKATIEELDEVEGIGEVRARAIKDGLRRLREIVLLDRDL